MANYLSNIPYHGWDKNLKSNLNSIDVSIVNGSLVHLLDMPISHEDPMITLASSIIKVHNVYARPGEYGNDIFTPNVQPQPLTKYGIKVVQKGILIGNQHPRVLERFKDTVLDHSVWQMAIRAYPGVKSGGHTRFGPAGKMRTIFVPIEYVWQIYHLYLENIGASPDDKRKGGGK